MSGILGFVYDRLQTVHPDRLHRALLLTEYRGLDGGILFHNVAMPSQWFFDRILQPLRYFGSHHPPNDLATAMLACCRTSKQDCSWSGGQAVDRAHGQVFLAFDGVVDNVQELSQELRKLGYKTRSTCQFDVILAALERWGPDCLSRITGSFALAAVDLHCRNLILARDAFGSRPLYYARPNGAGLYFSSHIGALLELASVTRKVNRASLYRYLAYNTMEHGAETFFAGIEQVPPGHYLEVSLDKSTQSSPICYQRVAPVRTKLTFGETVEHLRELVTRSVAAQIGANESAGAAVSGGFDSSFVVAAFKHAQLRAQLKLYNCVPVLRSGAFTQSEEEWASLVAARLQIPMSAIRVKSEDLPESFAALIRIQQEPFSSPVVYAQLQMFRAAQEDGVKVMLSGQGGDTIFATSADQLLLAALEQARRGHLGHAAALLQAGRELPQGSTRRLARAAARMAMPKSWQALARSWRQPASPDWLKNKWFEPDCTVFSESGLSFLRFEDRNSMACAILNRMPLLTTELQDFVSSLPPEYLVTKDQPMKSIEAEAMRGIIPDAILARRERYGFPVPVREWLGELAPWVESNMANIESFPFMEPRRVREIWESVRSLKGSVSEAFLIWRWVFLAGWVRHCGVSVE